MAIVTLAVDADGIALITLDDPARPANVTSPQLTAELIAAIDRVAADASIRGAVIASGKPGRFVAGGDIHDFVRARERGMTEAEAFEVSDSWNRELRRIERSGKPFAAAINGAALGGGFELALMCQHRVLVDDPRAIVGLVELSLGLLPAGGGSQRLPRLIGIDAALRLMLDARRLAPAEALAAGLVDAVVPAGRLLDTARAWVRDHPGAPQPWDARGGAAPDLGDLDTLRERWQHEVEQRYAACCPAPRALLNAVFDGVRRPLDEALRIEARCFAPLLPGVVARNLMRTGFVYRQQADKRARQALARGAPGVPPPVHEHDAAAPPPGGACLWLWPDAGQPALAEVASAPDAAPQLLDAALAHCAALGVTPVVLPPGRASFVRRLRAQSSLAARADEGRRALAVGDVACAADADLASVLSGSCPPWSGGVISLADMPEATAAPAIPSVHQGDTP
jgi:3-hydroxyacyl-CoA dehydrogenase/enoyl-CoA hydratase/3-hydroxybutyryl-CoA epimerase